MVDLTSAIRGRIASDAEIGGNYKWYALGILVVVYVFNFLDRQILAILQESIKADLGLSDTQLGLIGGFAFAIFYATLGIPIARLADRYSRSRIIAFAIGTWSLMTALCGAAGNFATLALARIGVGIGEAGCSPPAHSLISDLFDEKSRASALSIYALGIPIGVMLGFLAGGWLNDLFNWRVAFVVVGLPGVLMAFVIFFFLKEPPRGYAEGRPRETGLNETSIMDVFKVLMNRRAFPHIAIAGALHAFVGYGLGQWIPSFFIRIHDFSAAEIGTFLALGAGLVGSLGTLLGGFGSDRLAVRDVRWYAWWPALSLVVLMPFLMASLWVDNKWAAIAFYIVPSLLNAVYLGPTAAMVQGLVGVKMRAVASAILLFALNLIGLGLGPALVGFVSDLLNPVYGIESLRYAMMIAAIANIWSCIHYMLAARTLAEDLRAAKTDDLSHPEPIPSAVALAYSTDGQPADQEAEHSQPQAQAQPEAQPQPKANDENAPDSKPPGTKPPDS